jgi:hypothetical protein
MKISGVRQDRSFKASWGEQERDRVAAKVRGRTKMEAKARAMQAF